jgi:UDP-glucose-4-epimerase GalE
MILVTGGAGYVGSHTLREIGRAGEEVVVVDDLTEGHRDAAGDATLVEVDLGDLRALRQVFSVYDIDAVMHFAAACYVGESVQRPGWYYRQNVTCGWNLLEAMRGAGVDTIIFSSSCAVYGEPETVPIPEDCARHPINPYGRTKGIFEDMLADYARARGLRWTALRYFNAAGADPSGEIGEDHDPETHLIPLVVDSALGRRGPVTVFGNDYDTADGSCVRDYVHVSDLAAAHLLALNRLRGGGESRAFNLGLGTGASVLDVIAATKAVSGRDVPHEIGPRRPGDPAVLVADPGCAGEELGWTPRFTSLESILETAWAWHEAHADGFGDRT